MKLSKKHILWLILVAGILLPNVTWAQQEKPAAQTAEKDAQEHLIRVYQVKGDPKLLSNVIGTLYAENAYFSKLRMATDGQKIIIQGSRESHNLIENLISKLDSAVPGIRIFFLKHIPADQCLKLLEKVMTKAVAKEKLGMAVDPRTNSIVVSAASEEQIENIHELIEVFDQPKPSDLPDSSKGTISLELFWVVDGLDDSLVNVQKGNEMTRIVELTKKLGLKNPKLVSKAKVRCDLSTARSVSVANIPSLLGKDRQMSVSADIEPVEGAFQIELEVDAGSAMTTTIKTKPNHPICMGSLTTTYGDKLVESAFAIVVRNVK